MYGRGSLSFQTHAKWALWDLYKDVFSGRWNKLPLRLIKCIRQYILGFKNGFFSVLNWKLLIIYTYINPTWSTYNIAKLLVYNIIYCTKLCNKDVIFICFFFQIWNITNKHYKMYLDETHFKQPAVISVASVHCTSQV